jgi:tetratricopeptide (TPR) repeat protein
LLEAALNASVSARYREEVIFRLAQYYFASGLDGELALTVNRYRTEYENGRFDGHMRRLAIIADERAAKTETALRQLDRMLVSRADDEPSQWATIDKARIMMATDKRVAAIELLRRLSRQRSGPGPAQALYLLALDAFQYHRYDDAVFYYNLLREAYPKAVGLDVLIDKLSSVTGDEPEDDLAERLTGTFYSVKVGVFSQIENARRQRDNFTKYDRRVEILTKNISGRKYFVVYVGRFSSYESAEQLKANLEATHNEVFQVVTR